MENLMRKLQAEGAWVSVYTNIYDCEKFAFGRIICVGESFFAMATLALNGDNDGIAVLLTKDVFRIETDSKYGQKMVRLHQPFRSQPWLPALREDAMVLSALQEVKKANRLVSVELREERDACMTGWVENVDEHMVELRQVDEFGNPDGTGWALLEDISSLSFDSEQEKWIEAQIKSRSV